MIHLRFQHETGADNDGLDVVVEEHRHQRILQRWHHHRFVDEGILRAAHPRHVVAQPALLMLVHIVDDQHFKIRLRHRACLGRQHGLVVMLVLVDRIALQRNVPPSVGPGGQRPRDAPDAERQIVEIAVLELAAHVLEGGHAGKGPIGFDHGERRKDSVDLLAQHSRLFGVAFPRQGRGWFHVARSTGPSAVGSRKNSRCSHASVVLRWTRKQPGMRAAVVPPHRSRP